jgi:hypothetical protein
MREHRIVFAFVERDLRRYGQELTMPHFHKIAKDMADHFGRRFVQVGERLTSRDSNIIKRSNVERPMPERSGNGLHSYVTKADMYGNRYARLCRRILEGEDLVIPEEEVEEAEREPLELLWVSDSDEN